MCGHFGFVNFFEKKEMTAAEWAVHVSTVSQIAKLAAERGPDGYGMQDDKQITWNVGKPKDLPYTSHFLLGHFRLATDPATKNDLDALQPFRCSHITLAHNGFITNWREVMDKCGYMVSDWIKTDSQALTALRAHGIPLHSIMELADTGNAYAIVEHDSITEMLCIEVLNMPFYIKEDADADMVYWCSKPFEGAEPFTGQWYFSLKPITAD